MFKWVIIMTVFFDPKTNLPINTLDRMSTKSFLTEQACRKDLEATAKALLDHIAKDAAKGITVELNIAQCTFFSAYKPAGGKL